jgi:hypothetical protein
MIMIMIMIKSSHDRYNLTTLCWITWYLILLVNVVGNNVSLSSHQSFCSTNVYCHGLGAVTLVEIHVGRLRD